jgi:hypothetical protein
MWIWWVRVRVRVRVRDVWKCIYGWRRIAVDALINALHV